MNTWPTTLPQSPLLSSLSSEMKDNIIKSTVPAGQDKYRKRFSAVTTSWPVTLQLTQAQWATLRTFYDDNTCIEWNWIDPEDCTPAVVIFKSRPIMTGRRGKYRTVSFMIEVQL